MMKNNDGISMQDALRLAQSDAGKQLLSQLRQQNGTTIDKAMAQIAAGDAQQAKETLSSLLSSPQIRQLLEQLGRERDGRP